MSNCGFWPYPTCVRVTLARHFQTLAIHPSWVSLRSTKPTGLPCLLWSIVESIIRNTLTTIDVCTHLVTCSCMFVVPTVPNALPKVRITATMIWVTNCFLGRSLLSKRHNHDRSNASENKPPSHFRENFLSHSNSFT